MILLLTGCATTRAPEQPRLPTTNEMESMLAARVDSLRSWSCRARLYVTTKESNDSYEIDLALSRDKLRVNVPGPLGMTLAILVRRGDTLQVLSPMENILYQGRTSEMEEQDPLHLGIGLDDMITLIQGLPSLKPSLVILPSMLVAPLGEGLTFSWKELGTENILTYDRDKLLLREWTLRRPGRGGTIRAKYEDWVPVDGRERPRDITIEDLAEGRSVRVLIQRQRVNPELDPGIFQLDVPAGVERRALR